MESTLKIEWQGEKKDKAYEVWKMKKRRKKKWMKMNLSKGLII